MSDTKQDMQQSPSPPTCRVRSACDLCHQSKVKCSGGNPCSGCHKLGLRCNYSSSNRTGRPRGVKNKGTRQRLRALEAAEAEREAGARCARSAAFNGSTASSSRQSSSRQSPSSCNIPTDIGAADWGGYVGFDPDQMDTLLVSEHAP